MSRSTCGKVDSIIALQLDLNTHNSIKLVERNLCIKHSLGMCYFSAFFFVHTLDCLNILDASSVTIWSNKTLASALCSKSRCFRSMWFSRKLSFHFYKCGWINDFPFICSTKYDFDLHIKWIKNWPFPSNTFIPLCQSMFGKLDSLMSIHSNKMWMILLAKTIRWCFLLLVWFDCHRSIFH